MSTRAPKDTIRLEVEAQKLKEKDKTPLKLNRATRRKFNIRPERKYE